MEFPEDGPPLRGPRRVETMPARFAVPEAAPMRSRATPIDEEVRFAAPRRQDSIRPVERRSSNLSVYDGRDYRHAFRRAKSQPLGDGSRRSHRRSDRSRSRSRSHSRNRDRSPSRSRSRSPDSLEDEDPIRSSYLDAIIIPHTAYSDSDSDSDINNEAYPFNLSRHAGNSMSRDSTLASISELSEGGTGSTVESEPLASQPSSHTTHHVTVSKYTGERGIGSLHTADLTIINDPNTDMRRKRSEIYSWMHIQDAAIDLDEFQDRCLSYPSLSVAQKRGIKTLLNHVRKRYDKPAKAPGGARCSFMSPSFVQETLPLENGQRDLRPRKVTWLCLPYFWLGKYSEGNSRSQSSHPTRPLLQSWNSSTPKARDLQQAVCRLKDTPQGHCYHVAQMWCLILEDSFIVTCASVPISILHGGSITVTPPQKPRGLGADSRMLLVSSGKAQLWSFPLMECQSWFAFMSHFWEYWPWRFRVMYNGKVIGPDDWPRILSLARRSNIQIYLDFKMSSKKPVRGILPDSIDDSLPENNRAGTASRVQQVRSLSTEAHEMAAEDPNLGATESLTEVETIGVQPNTSNSDRRPNNGTIQEPSQQSSPATSSYTLNSTSGGFHVFTWLNSRRTTDSPQQSGSSLLDTHGPQITSPAPNGLDDTTLTVDGQGLIRDLEEVDRFLMHRTSLNDLLTYKRCSLHTRWDLYTKLVRERAGVENPSGTQLRFLKIHETRVSLFNAASSTFQFFLPFTLNGPTIRKYWGAIYDLLFSSTSPNEPRDTPGEESTALKRSAEDPENLEIVLDGLERITRRTEPFRDFFSRASASERSRIYLPEEFSRAWLHLLIAVAFGSKEIESYSKQIMICTNLLEAGIDEVLPNLTGKSLVDNLILAPLGLASLISLDLLQNTPRPSTDIGDKYQEYLRLLDSDIEADPLDRSHQDSISKLKREIRIIQDTLDQQQRVLRDAQSSLKETPSCTANRNITTTRQRPRNLTETAHFRDVTYDSRRYAREYVPGDGARNLETYYTSQGPIRASPGLPASQLSATDPQGIQGLLIQDCLSRIEKYRQGFEEISDQASVLEDSNILSIDLYKDRQENAIYAFTFVTIVFLPLSTVAGILGMNTYDVRNMNNKQWVFWAVALPLTAIIIGLCLVWTGELGAFWRGVKGMFSLTDAGKRRRENVERYRYQMGPEAYSGLQVPRRHRRVMRRSTSSY